MLALLAKALATPLGRKVAGFVGIGLALLCIAFELMHIGANGVRKSDAKATAKRDAQVHQIDTQTATIAAKAGSDAATSQTQIVYRTRTLIQKARDEKASLGDGRLNAEWVRSLDAAWGLPAGPAATQGAAPDTRTVSAADALPVLQANAGKCDQYRDLWQRTVAFYDQQARAVNGR